LRVALIGLGLHSQRVLLPALQLLGVEVTAVLDPVAERREAVVRRTGATAYADLGDLLAHESFDAVVAAPSRPAHSCVLDQLIPIGRPIFIEKPAGLTAEAIVRSAELARESGTSVQVGFMRRFAPAYRLAKSISGAWAVPLALQLRMVAGPCADDEVFLKDVAIHYLDLARFFLGDIRKATADVLAMGPGTPSAWQIALRAERGAATLLLSHRGTWGNPTESLWVDGPGQAVEVGNVENFRHYRAGRQGPSDDLPAKQAAGGTLSWQPNLASTGLTHQSIYLQGYLPELEAFVQTVQFRAPVQATLDDAGAAMRLAEQLLAEQLSAEQLLADGRPPEEGF